MWLFLREISRQKKAIVYFATRNTKIKFFLPIFLLGFPQQQQENMSLSIGKGIGLVMMPCTYFSGDSFLCNQQIMLT